MIVGRIRRSPWLLPLLALALLTVSAGSVVSPARSQEEPAADSASGGEEEAAAEAGEEMPDLYLGVPLTEIAVIKGATSGCDAPET